MGLSVSCTGDCVGVDVGELVGLSVITFSSVGAAVGELVGLSVMIISSVGVNVGELVGLSLITISSVGVNVGELVGVPVIKISSVGLGVSIVVSAKEAIRSNKIIASFSSIGDCVGNDVPKMSFNASCNDGPSSIVIGG